MKKTFRTTKKKTTLKPPRTNWRAMAIQADHERQAAISAADASDLAAREWYEKYNRLATGLRTIKTVLDEA